MYVTLYPSSLDSALFVSILTEFMIRRGIGFVKQYCYESTEVSRQSVEIIKFTSERDSVECFKF